MNLMASQKAPATMQIFNAAPQGTCDESEVYGSILPLANARILELGCGKAEKTRAISQSYGVASITALEVDKIQHEKNLLNQDLPIVTFALGGAEAIPAPDDSFDIVMMFKSLHHVPGDLMDQAMKEIRRVLKKGGLAYISEPVYAGDFNEVLRMFHDEKEVREKAFAAVKRAVEGGLFELVEEKFFNTPSHFDSFEQFEERILKVTHTHHQLAPELYQAVRTKFMSHVTDQGANFLMPIRVDLLRKA